MRNFGILTVSGNGAGGVHGGWTRDVEAILCAKPEVKDFLLLKCEGIARGGRFEDLILE